MFLILLSISFLINACTKDGSVGPLGNSNFDSYISKLSINKGLESEKRLEEFFEIQQTINPAILNDMPEFVNGRLKFRDIDHYLSFYDELYQFHLTNLQLGHLSPYYLDPENPAVLDPYGALIAFESNFNGYISGRKIDVLQESFDLLNDIEPTGDYTGNYTEDIILNSLINSDFEVQIGNDILINIGNVTFVTPDERSLNEIKIGRLVRGNLLNPWEINNNIKLHEYEARRFIRNDDDDDCRRIKSEFTANGFGLSYNFIFTGFPHPNQTSLSVSYNWSFGDGNTSNVRNPSHTFSAPGTYTVSLLVELFDETTGTYCNSFFSMNVKAERVDDSNDCEWWKALYATFVWNQTGTPGVLCFTPTGTLFAQIIDQDVPATYFWNFGDGNTSTEMFPCHTFFCDKPYTITLLVALQSGCVIQLTLPVDITSYGCCAKSATLESQIEHNQDGHPHKVFFKQNLSAVWPHWWTNECKIIVEMKNYKRKDNGKYTRKSNAYSLSANIYGNAYSPAPGGCVCQDPYDLTDTGNETNSWRLDYRKGVSGRISTKYQFEWGVRYRVNGVDKGPRMTPAFCK